MRAAIYPGGGKPLVIEHRSDPTPGAEDLLVKIQRCGICGTDLHLTSGHRWDFPPGTIGGHEYAGEVVELGAKVTGYKKGDLVTALPSTGCGHCEACRRGNLVLCHNAPGLMGGWGEYLRVPTSVAVKLPSTLSLTDGALIEPLAVGLHGVRMARLQAGDRVLVLGAGAVALCAIYWARRLGAARIAALSRSPRRAAMALEMGADTFVQSGSDEVREVTEALGGKPSIVFECVGSPGLLTQGIQHAADFGQVISLGFCTEPDPILPAVAGMKGVSLQFPVGYTLKDFEHVAEVMDAGHADPKMLVSSVVTLDELPETLQRLRGPHTDTKVHVSL
jgi:2-desacetyl-2-hydroxyethyl bacteriochlorophyllide A dehydrogenase